MPKEPLFHMMKGVAANDVTVKCGLRFKKKVGTKPNPDHFATIWFTRVTCPKCIEAMRLKDEDLPW